MSIKVLFLGTKKIFLEVKKPDITFHKNWCPKIFKNNCSHVNAQEYSRLRCLLRVKGLVICFYLGWSGSTLLITEHIIKFKVIATYFQQQGNELYFVIIFVMAILVCCIFGFNPFSICCLAVWTMEYSQRPF